MIEGVVFDCRDPEPLAEFWAEVTGGVVAAHSSDWVTVGNDPNGHGPGVTLAFQRVPEPKSVKNRIHLDLGCDDLDVQTERLVALGATTTGNVVTDEMGRFQVFQDPEGNEFCLVTGPDTAL